MCSAGNRGSNSPQSSDKFWGKYFLLAKDWDFKWVWTHVSCWKSLLRRGRMRRMVSLTSPRQRKKEPDDLMQEELEFLKMQNFSFFIPSCNSTGHCSLSNLICINSAEHMLLPNQPMNRRGQVNIVSGSKLLTQQYHAEALARCTTTSLWS